MTDRPRNVPAPTHSHPHDHGFAHSHSHSHSHDLGRPQSEQPSHAHDHDPGHSHSHTEGPGFHEHDFPAALASRNPILEPGAGAGQLLLLDTPSGISGDMTIGALLDLGVPFAVIQAAAESLGLEGYRLEVTSARAGAIGGSRFVVHVTGPQPHRRYIEIDALLTRTNLEPRTLELARSIFRRLAEAESEVHRIAIGDVEFHEVGDVDAIIDIVGAAACFAYLGARVVATPLPMGRGEVQCQHGLLPLPSPAALLCLRGVPTYDAGIQGELVTPTGAAIVATVASEFLSWPSFAPHQVGWGLGTRELPGRPNALRAVLGSPTAKAGADASHVVLEANVDDLTGELAAHAMDALLEAGALDAWAQPITMKKGRPALTLSALVEQGRADSVAEVFLRETSSIGVRRLSATRTERPRRIVEVDTPFGRVPVKVSEGGFGSALAKPEFDVCARLARAANVSVRDVLSAALVAVSRKL